MSYSVTANNKEQGAKDAQIAEESTPKANDLSKAVFRDR